MDFHKLILYYHTLKFLRFKQIIFRVFYIFRNRLYKQEYKKNLKANILPLKWEDSFLFTESYKKNKTFRFLNVSQSFESEIDWNYNTLGKLWTYNLNYFDFLNQKEISTREGLDLIQDYIDNGEVIKDGKEPYVISLRGINWIKFLSKRNISSKEINQFLFNDYITLLHNLEYHLLGNHLLENGFSLLFGAYYFKNEILYKKAKIILKEELEEQILNDGAHFELSPMYHQIVLFRLLDCIQLIALNNWNDDELCSFLKKKAIAMLSWLEEITYSNGNIPMVNDSAYGISPKSKQLFKYAKDLGLFWAKAELSDSGYRKFKEYDYELFMDVGSVGPVYQPGHAHSDTFNFELIVRGNPIIVDTGTSTYEKSDLRQKERETASHNTVKIGNKDQTQVWGGFRVGERANILCLEEGHNQVSATHDGYRRLNALHTRKFFMEPGKIILNDCIYIKNKEEQIAFFHFHPSIYEIEVLDNQVRLIKVNVKIVFEGAIEIKLLSYGYAKGFNQTENSYKISVSFQNNLNTQIYL